MGRSSGLSDATRSEALGRVFQALREGECLRDYLPKLDWWPTLERGWAIEWQSGPFSYEIAERLMSRGRERDDSPNALYGFVGNAYQVGEHRSSMFVCGVSVELRALEPVGYDVVHRRVWDEMRRTFLPSAAPH